MFNVELDSIVLRVCTVVDDESNIRFLGYDERVIFEDNFDWDLRKEVFKLMKVLRFLNPGLYVEANSLFSYYKDNEQSSSDI